MSLPILIQPVTTRCEATWIRGALRNASGGGVWLECYGDLDLLPGQTVEVRVTVPLRPDPDAEWVLPHSDLAAFLEIEPYAALVSRGEVVRIASVRSERILGTGIAIRLEEPLAFTRPPERT